MTTVLFTNKRSRFWQFAVFLVFIFGGNKAFSQNNFQQLITTSSKSLEEGNVEEARKKATKALNLANESNVDDELFQALNLLGNIERWDGKMDLALEYLWKSKQIEALADSSLSVHHLSMARLFHDMNAIYLEKDEYIQSYQLNQNFYTAGRIGNIYLDINQPDSAIFYFKDQLHLSEQHQDSLESIYAFNNLGYGLMESNLYDSALWYFEQAIKYSEYANNSNRLDSLSLGMIHGNIGMIYLHQDQLDLAIEHLEIDLIAARKFTTDKNLIIFVAEGLVDAYLKSNETEKLKVLLDELTGYKDQLTTEMKVKLSNQELKYYLQLESDSLYLSRIEEHIKLVEQHEKEIEESTLEATELLANYRINGVKAELEVEKLNTAVAEQKVKEIWLYSGIAIVVLGSLLIYFIQRRRKAQVEAQLLASEKERLDYKLQLKQIELTDFAINLNRNIELSDEIAQRFKQIKRLSGEDLNNGLNELSMFINQNLNTGSSLETFQTNIDKINNEFFIKLQELHPNLSKQELEKCGLIKLKLSNKEISQLKNISVQSARNARHRIKKKLDLEKDDDLENYLNSL